MKQPIQFKEDDDIIEICKDNVFKAVFTKEMPESRKALSCLVSALIGRKVDIITILANEIPVGNTRERQIRFDINCKAKNGELVNIEMSFNPKPFEPVRLEFHAGKLFVSQDIRGKKKNFNDLKQTYQIAILANEKFFNDSEFYHIFEYYDKGNKVSLNGKTQIITLELSKSENIIKKPIESMKTREYWAVFFRYLTDRNKREIINSIVKNEEGIEMASQVVMTISRDEEERARLLRDEMIELDWQNGIVTAERKGIKIGEKRGEKKIIELLESGKTPEEIISEYKKKRGGYRNGKPSSNDNQPGRRRASPSVKGRND